MKKVEEILDNEADVLSFLRTRYPLHHLSNVFFRDLQYGIQTMLEWKGLKVGYSDAERYARTFAEKLEKKKMLVPIDQQSWVLHNEQFKTVSAKKPVAAKPAAEKPAAPRPGGGLPPLQSAIPAGATRPAAGLPPLKSAAPAGAAKPAGGLPPLKSSAPTGSAPAQPPASPVAEATPAASPAAEPKPAPPAAAKPAPAPATKSATPPPKGGLPPISSSVPAGGKK